MSKQSASQLLDKPLPSNLAYERYVLGAALCACLFGDRTCEKLIEILKRDDFYLDSHKLIYDAIKQLLESNSPVNEYTVYQWLRKNNPSKDCGGAVYLADFLTRLIVTKDLKRFACEVNIAAGSTRSYYVTPDEVARVIHQPVSYVQRQAAAAAV